MFHWAVKGPDGEPAEVVVHASDPTAMDGRPDASPVSEADARDLLGISRLARLRVRAAEHPDKAIAFAVLPRRPDGSFPT